MSSDALAARRRLSKSVAMKTTRQRLCAATVQARWSEYIPLPRG